MHSQSISNVTFNRKKFFSDTHPFPSGISTISLLSTFGGHGIQEKERYFEVFGVPI